MELNLNQVTVHVSNIEKSIYFYELLGLRLIVKSSNYARFECKNGESTFSIHLSSLKIESSTWIYFESNNLDHDVDDLISRGVQLEELPNDKPWLWREARIKDPDNHIIILYHAGKNRKNPPWRINRFNHE